MHDMTRCDQVKVKYKRRRLFAVHRVDRDKFDTLMCLRGGIETVSSVYQYTQVMRIGVWVYILRRWINAGRGDAIWAEVRDFQYLGGLKLLNRKTCMFNKISNLDRPVEEEGMRRFMGTYFWWKPPAPCLNYRIILRRENSMYSIDVPLLLAQEETATCAYCCVIGRNVRTSHNYTTATIRQIDINTLLQCIGTTAS